MSASWYERGEAVRERWLWFYDAVGGTGDRDDMMTLALEMLAAAEAVVAVQREALRECDAVIAVMTSYVDDLLDRARAANTPSLTHGDNAGPFGHYAQARLEELVGKVSALVVARAALDAEGVGPTEGVSEPGEAVQGQGERGHTGESEPLSDADVSQPGTLPAAPTGPGSLTSPVDLAAVVAVQREALLEIIEERDEARQERDKWRAWHAVESESRQRFAAWAAEAQDDAARAEGVVAVQREALRLADDALRDCWEYEAHELDDVTGQLHAITPRAKRVEAALKAMAALDAEGVSEPPLEGSRLEGGGSLTSPVDTAPMTADAYADLTARGLFPHLLPAPRGYVTNTADGPVGVYHAETPDAYLAKGDRP